MTSVYDSFRPTDIGPNIRVPMAVLRPRAQELTEITSGILRGEIVSEREEDWSSHRLDVIVPALRNLRQGLLTVRHMNDVPYPAFVQSPNFAWQAAAMRRALIPGEYGVRRTEGRKRSVQRR
jgi:hypothetical protein